MIMIMIIITITKRIINENGEVKVTWDMTIYTDKILKHNRSRITLVNKDTQKWTLIDIAVPADQNIIRTEEEKVAKYQDLAFEIRRTHGALEVYRWRPFWEQPICYVKCCVSELRGVVET